MLVFNLFFIFFEIKRAIIAGSVAPGGSISIIFQRLYSVYTVTTMLYTLAKNNERDKKKVVIFDIRLDEIWKNLENFGLNVNKILSAIK